MGARGQAFETVLRRAANRGGEAFARALNDLDARVSAEHGEAITLQHIRNVIAACAVGGGPPELRALYAAHSDRPLGNLRALIPELDALLIAGLEPHVGGPPTASRAASSQSDEEAFAQLRRLASCEPDRRRLIARQKAFLRNNNSVSSASRRVAELRPLARRNFERCVLGGKTA